MSYERLEVVRWMLLRQQGMFELAQANPQIRKWAKRPEIAETLKQDFSAWQYIRPHGARWRKGEPLVRTVSEPSGSLLWLDFDSTTPEQAEERRAYYELPKPGLSYHTGGSKPGSVWWFYKLTRPMYQDDLEKWMAMLEDLLGADHCHNVDRLVRIPMTFHAETGVQGWIIEHTKDQVDPTLLADIHYSRYLPMIEAERESATRRTTKPKLPKAEYVEVECECDLHSLTDAHVAYIQHGTYTRASRSEVEQSIFYRLVSLGYTNEEIAYLAHHRFRLAKTCEEIEANRHASVMARIVEVGRYFDERRGRIRNPSPDTLAPHRRRRQFLSLFSEKRRTTSEVLRDGAEVTGLSERQCRNLRKEALRAAFVTWDNRITQYGTAALTRRSPIFEYEADLLPYQEDAPQVIAADWSECEALSERIPTARQSSTPTYVSHGFHRSRATAGIAVRGPPQDEEARAQHDLSLLRPAVIERRGRRVPPASPEVKHGASVP